MVGGPERVEICPRTPSQSETKLAQSPGRCEFPKVLHPAAVSGQLRAPQPMASSLKASLSFSGPQAPITWGIKSKLLGSPFKALNSMASAPSAWLPVPPPSHILPAYCTGCPVVPEVALTLPWLLVFAHHPCNVDPLVSIDRQGNRLPKPPSQPG